MSLDLWGYDDSVGKTAARSWYHMTRNPDLTLDENYVPHSADFKHRPGIYLSPSQEPHFSRDGSPYVAEIEGPENLADLPGAYSGENEVFVPSQHMHLLKVKGVSPAAGPLAAWSRGEGEWPEDVHTSSFDRDVAEDLMRLAGRDVYAALTQDLVDGLDEQFHDWYTDHGKHLDPFSHKPNPQGPVGDWRNVERFLQQHYPAAHKGLEMGLEEAGPLMDGRPPTYMTENGLSGLFTPPKVTPYDTGPDAMSQHGYDPKEIAAGMLLLHNQSHPFRGEMAQEDTDRLVDIYTKRQQMQRDYLRRLNMPPSSAGDDSTDVGLVHAKHLGQFVLREGAGPNEQDIGFGEPGDSVSRPDGRSAALPYVPHVFERGSGSKMSGLDADPPVAGMQDERFLFSNRVVSVEDSVGGHMSVSGAPLLAAEASVPIGGRGRPVPAPFVGRVVGHEPTEGFFLRESGGPASTLSHIDISASRHQGMPMLYHHTSPENADSIRQERKFRPNSEYDEFTYVSDKPNGNGSGWGPSRVDVNVPDDDFQYDFEEDPYQHDGGHSPPEGETFWRARSQDIKPEWIESARHYQQLPWEDAPDGGWTHPSGFAISPSDEPAYEGSYQLWGPTSGFGNKPAGLAKIKRPHPDPKVLMDWAERTMGKPKTASAQDHPSALSYADWCAAKKREPFDLDNAAEYCGGYGEASDAKPIYDWIKPHLRTADVSFPYLRNNGGMRTNADPDDYSMNSEPWGRYMSPDADEHHLPLQKGWERGDVSFDNPLYVPHNYGGWKQDLADQYGATGQQLSEKLMADGYDGVITHDKYGIGEMVDIRPKDQRGHRVHP